MKCEGYCSDEYIGMADERWIHWTSEDNTWVIGWHLSNTSHDDIHPWEIHGEASGPEVPYDETNWSSDIILVQGECVPLPTPTPEETPTPTPTPTPEETPTPTPTPEETPTPTPTPTPEETPTPTPTLVFRKQEQVNDNVISTPMYDTDVPENMGPYFVPWKKSSMEYYNKLTGETIANSGYLKGSTLGNIPIKSEDENSETQETD